MEILNRYSSKNYSSEDLRRSSSNDLISSRFHRRDWEKVLQALSGFESLRFETSCKYGYAELI